jgi:hypothetical protein
MARGDQSDFLWRLKATLPPWFGELSSAPVLSGILEGLAWAHAQCWSWWTYVRAQGRIATATGVNLDEIALDFLGYHIARDTGETDDHFRARLKREILRPKGTRAALLQLVQDLTGYPGQLVEPWNPQDCGGYASLAASGGGGVGYGSLITSTSGAGAWGTLSLPYQCFLICLRPGIVPPPGVNGYASLTVQSGCAAGGYGTMSAPTMGEGASEWLSLSSVQGETDDDLYAAIASVAPIGVVVWTQLSNVPPTVGSRLDVDLILDESTVQ